MGNSIEVKGLTLSFGSISVLKNMNLDVAEGEFVVLLGPSGCGKSTLLNCLAGVPQNWIEPILARGMSPLPSRGAARALAWRSQVPGGTAEDHAALHEAPGS